MHATGLAACRRLFGGPSLTISVLQKVTTVYLNGVTWFALLPLTSFAHTVCAPVGGTFLSFSTEG